jgi:antirestriction protein ArdC
MATPIVDQSVFRSAIPAVNQSRPHASVYDIVPERILAELEKGEIPWRKPWRTLPPANLILMPIR